MIRNEVLDIGKLTRDYAGQWVAWDREQKRILGSGHTFEGAKQAAAAAGEASILLAKIPAVAPPRRGRHWLYVVAAFISVLGGPDLASSKEEGAAISSAPPISSAPTNYSTYPLPDDDDDVENADPLLD